MIDLMITDGDDIVVVADIAPVLLSDDDLGVFIRFSRGDGGI